MEFLYGTLLNKIVAFDAAKIQAIVTNRARPFRDCWEKLKAQDPAVESKFQDSIDQVLGYFNALTAAKEPAERYMIIVTPLIQGSHERSLDEATSSNNR